MLAKQEIRIGTVWEENFSSGFDIGCLGDGSRWNLLELGPFCPRDGIVSLDGDGLVVVSAGLHPKTGEPAFTQTIGQSGKTGGAPGMLDHIKWSASANHVSSKGYTGFDTPPGSTIYIEAVMGGRTFGTEHHPFGRAVGNPQGDFRLAAAAMVNMDKETNIVFDFFLTNNTIYALYERAPFARELFGDYASFSYGVPVGSRTPDDFHRLAVSYDRDANTARWFVDDVLVLEVDRIGRRIDRKYIFLDVGGEEQIVELNQLGAGIGMFSIMDGSFEGGPGLVDLPGFPMYFDTAAGAPKPLTFVDDESRDECRIFGQGARVTCRNFSIAYL